MSKNKRTYEQVKEEFMQRGYELVSKEYNKESDYLDYLCVKHKDKGVQKTVAYHFYSGSGCVYCAREERAEKRRKLNYEQVKEIFEKRGYELLSTEYKSVNEDLLFICPKHRDRGVLTTKFARFQRCAIGCKYCSLEDKAKASIKLDFEQVKKLFEKRGYELVSTDYKGVSKKLEYICPKHRDKGTQFVTFSNFKKSGCRYCAIEEKSKKRALTLEEFQEKVSQKNKNIIALEYHTSRTSAKFQCMKCGYIWESSPFTVTTWGKRCSNCEHNSKGEESISEILREWGIDFKGQYKFEGCRDTRPLPFDFYLPDYNICIEYDGGQHFQGVVGWGNYDTIKKHDDIKNEFCLANNIILIRIPYWEKDNLEYYLFDNLVKYGVISETTDTD